MGKVFSKNKHNDNGIVDVYTDMIAIIDDEIAKLRKDDELLINKELNKMRVKEKRIIKKELRKIKIEDTEKYKQLQTELETERSQRLALQKENRKLVDKVFNNSSDEDENIKSIINSTVISEYVDEILKDENINIAYLPDIVEGSIYKNVIRLILIIIGKIGNTAALDLFGHKLHMVVSPANQEEEEAGAIVDVPLAG